MMRITEVCLLLLLCHQPEPADEVRSRRLEMGLIPERAVPFLSF
jgi:hypothetical protein